MIDKTRESIYNILYDVYYDEAYSNIRIQKELDSIRKGINGNFLREVVYGVIENSYYIDYIIRKYSNVRIKKIDKKALIVLRIGVYQILFMDNIPDRASVNESVNLMKTIGNSKYSGFINGILRNISRNKEEALKIDVETKEEYLSIRYSHPKWLVERWLELYGYRFTQELCEANNITPELNIRVNKRKVNINDLKCLLENYGFLIEKGKFSSDILKIKNPTGILDLKEYKDGYYTVQDESSSLVAIVMDPEKDSLVIDMCAAPGGKTSHIGEMLDNTGQVLAFDIHSNKINLIKNTAKRLGLENIKVKAHDATVYNEDLESKGDYVLLDVPCSGYGIIRRKPDIKLKKSGEDLTSLNKIQKEILEQGKKYVKKGGYLIYSTCTIEPKENIDMISDFLEINKNFSLVDISEKLLDSKSSIDSLKEGYIQLYPNIHKVDGFFIAKMRRDR